MKDKHIYFSDTATGSIELEGWWPMCNKEFASRFPGIKGMKSDGFSKKVGQADGREIYPVTRIIRYKACPSNHVCNAKCMGGKVDGMCECSCGGANHGRSAFTVAK